MFNPSKFDKNIITENNYLIFQFLVNRDPISAKSATQILSLNLAYALLFLIFLITCLYSSSDISSFTLDPDPVFYQNVLYVLNYLFL